MKTKILFQQQNISYDTISINKFIFEVHRISGDLSMMGLSYKLTKRTETVESFLKKIKIISFHTILYELPELSKIMQLILNQKF